MKTKNKEELKAIAADIFSRYKRAKNVSVTSDGMAFITDESELAVKNHAVNNRYGKKLAITAFGRDDMKVAQKVTSKANPKTAKELIATIEAATTVEVVAAIIATENEGEKRVTVLEAGNDKIETLKALEVASKDEPKSAKDLIADIEAATTVGVVAAIITTENEGEKRVTVLKAGNDKLDSLKADV